MCGEPIQGLKTLATFVCPPGKDRSAAFWSLARSGPCGRDVDGIAVACVAERLEGSDHQSGVFVRCFVGRVPLSGGRAVDSHIHKSGAQEVGRGDSPQVQPGRFGVRRLRACVEVLRESGSWSDDITGSIRGSSGASAGSDVECCGSRGISTAARDGRAAFRADQACARRAALPSPWPRAGADGVVDDLYGCERGDFVASLGACRRKPVIPPQGAVCRW